jgi:hypothetical protein
MAEKSFDLIATMRDPQRANEFVIRVLMFVVFSWAAFAGVWLAYTICTWTSVLDPAKLGQFGDTFGAVNALFSGLALTGVAYAVVLQHQELDATQEQLKLARDEAKGEDAARKKSEQILDRQATALLAAARLNAATAINAAIMGHEQTIVRVGDRCEQVLDRDKYRQYMRIILNDISGLEPGPTHAPPEGASMFRRYLLSLLREAEIKIRGTPRLDDGDMYWIMMKLRDEVMILSAQDGVEGSRDSPALETANVLLERLGVRSQVEAGTDDFYKEVVNTLGHIISLARMPH